MKPPVLHVLKTSLERQGYVVSRSNEVTSPEVLAIAARGISDPAGLTPEEIKSVCASALTQAPDRRPLDDSQN